MAMLNIICIVSFSLGFGRGIVTQFIETFATPSIRL